MKEESTDYKLKPFLLLLILPIISGCFYASPDDQELPWSRPADWEGGIPGMGN